MKQNLITILLAVFFMSSLGFSQWNFVGPWPDDTYKGGTHGIVLTPDGKVWTASYYKEAWVTPQNDTIQTSPIYIFNSDGTLDTKIYTVTSGSVVDTLGLGGSTSGCRGLAVGPDGNVVFVSGAPSKMVKIDYQTRQGMGSRLIGDEVGSSPAGAAITDDGTIYIGPVVGNGSPSAFIVTYAPDLTYLGAVVTGPPAIARTMAVSGDGLSIYWTTFTGSQGITIYTRASDLDPFVLTDSAFTAGSLGSTLGMSIETAAWNPATGLLWVSNDSRGNSMFSNLTWYGVDVTNNYAIVDSFSFTPTGNSDELPRGLAFSPDGKTAYVGFFGSAFDRMYTFENITAVEDEGQIVVDGYKLSQNYPNPFNPTTKINFELKTSGYTTLIVYDMLGTEVATLVQNELTSGSHSVNFNAANLASGTYVYQLNVNGTRITNKMVLLK